MANLHLDRRIPQILSDAEVAALPDDALIDLDTLAAWWGITRRCLEVWEKKGIGPELVSLGPRLKRCRVGTARDWLRRRTGVRA